MLLRNTTEMDLSLFPAINASLNAMSAVLLVLGYVLIRRKAQTGHVACMLSAVGTSTLFLACYLYYHWHHGSTPFRGTGWIRAVYFTILISHTILAVVIVPLIFRTLFHASKFRWEAHARIARITFPIWLYVSLTGVTIYWMLYQMNFR